MENKNKEMFDFLSNHISKGDIYAAKITAKISMFIFEYRQKENLTQKDFAEKMGVTQAMISKWESAEYNFTIETISQICAKLNMSFDIEIKPESEYLQNNNNDAYDGLAENHKWHQNGRVLQIAA